MPSNVAFVLRFWLPLRNSFLVVGSRNDLLFAVPSLPSTVRRKHPTRRVEPPNHTEPGANAWKILFRILGICCLLKGVLLAQKSERLKRKQMAEERRRKLMSQMNLQQKSFLQANASLSETIIASDSGESDKWGFAFFIFCVCRNNVRSSHLLCEEASFIWRNLYLRTQMIFICNSSLCWLGFRCFVSEQALGPVRVLTLQIMLRVFRLFDLGDCIRPFVLSSSLFVQAR